MAIIKNNSYVFLFFSVILLFSVFYVLTAVGSDEKMSHVQIEEGDTLWTLAEKFSGTKPHHEWISEIMKENNMQTAKIKAGETIKIPSEQLKYVPDSGIQYAGDEQ